MAPLKVQSSNGATMEKNLKHRVIKSPSKTFEDEELGLEPEEERRALLAESGASPPTDQQGWDNHGHPKQMKGPLATLLDSLDPRLKFAIIVCLVMLFFGLHNVLQEKLVALPGFHFKWSLAMMEAVGVLLGSSLERLYEGSWNSKRVAPFRNYVLLAGLLGMSSSLSNIALNFIKYPTKVIFRSCKLIPTMVIAVVWRKKFVSRGEFIAAGAVCAGLIIFAQADAKLEPDFDPIGIAMVILSVCADAFLPNLQEQVFTLGASRVEVTFFTNLLTVMAMLLSTTASGNLMEFFRYAATHREATMYMTAYCLLSHVAIAAHMMVVKEYGGVTAVLVGNTRKAMTIALSFLLFPNPFSYHFVLGGGLVLGGLVVNVKIKDARRKAEDERRRQEKQDEEKGTEISTPTSALAMASICHSPSDTTAQNGGGGGGRVVRRLSSNIALTVDTTPATNGDGGHHHRSPRYSESGNNQWVEDGDGCVRPLMVSADAMAEGMSMSDRSNL